MTAIAYNRGLPSGFHPQWLGMYDSLPTRSLILATSQLVSALIRVYIYYPNGEADGFECIAETETVPSGKSVGILKSLIDHQSLALPAIARAVQRALLDSTSSESRCPKSNTPWVLKQRQSVPSIASDIKTTPDLALLHSRLAVGFRRAN
jgi:hypothetical protein